MYISIENQAMALLEEVSSCFTPEQLTKFQDLKQKIRNRYITEFDNYNFD